MGAIPLPALHIQDQQQSPLAMYAQAQQIRNAQTQQQTAQLQQQGLQQQNQMQALALQDNMTLRSLGPKYVQKDENGKVTGYDIEGLLNEGAEKQVNPNTLNDMRLKYADAVQKTAAAGSAQIDFQDKKNDQAYQVIEGVRAIQDPAQRQAATQQEAQRLQQLGQPVPPSWDDAGLQAFEAHLGVHKQVLADAKTVEDTKKAAAEAQQAQTGAQKNTAEIQGLTGQFAEAKYRNILGALSAGKQVSDDDLTFAKSYEAANRKSTTQSDTLGVTTTSTSGPAGLASLRLKGGSAAPSGAGTSAPSGTQGTKDSLVDLIGQYKADPQTLSRLMIKHPEILGMVHDKYPDWDQTTYQAKNKMVQSYTSGPESKSINAISTALGHAGELGQAIDALGNSNGMNMLRDMGNRFGVSILGDDKVTAFNTIVHRLSPEITAAYVQGGGGEHERAANEADFAAALGDKQLRSNLGETVKLLRSKIAAQEQQWNNTYRPTRPEDDFSTRFLTPQAKTALQKYSPQSGVQPTGAAAHTPGGEAVGLKDGATGTGSDGKKYIVKG